MLPALRNDTMLAPTWTAPFNRLDSLFDRVFGDDGAFLNQGWAGSAVSLWEDEDHLYVEAEVPGVAEADLDITVHEGRLFIRGERKPAQGRTYLYNGRSFGRFERIVTLPEAVDTENVRAELVNGVLHVTLPKKPEAKPKKIMIAKS